MWVRLLILGVPALNALMHGSRCEAVTMGKWQNGWGLGDTGTPGTVSVTMGSLLAAAAWVTSAAETGDRHKLGSLTIHITKNTFHLFKGIRFGAREGGWVLSASLASDILEKISSNSGQSVKLKVKHKATINWCFKLKISSIRWRTLCPRVGAGSKKLL